MSADLNIFARLLGLRNNGCAVTIELDSPSRVCIQSGLDIATGKGPTFEDAGKIALASWGAVEALKVAA